MKKIIIVLCVLFLGFYSLSCGDKKNPEPVSEVEEFSEIEGVSLANESETKSADDENVEQVDSYESKFGKLKNMAEEFKEKAGKWSARDFSGKYEDFIYLMENVLDSEPTKADLQEIVVPFSEICTVLWVYKKKFEEPNDVLFESKSKKVIDRVMQFAGAYGIIIPQSTLYSSNMKSLMEFEKLLKEMETDGEEFSVTECVEKLEKLISLSEDFLDEGPSQKDLIVYVILMKRAANVGINKNSKFHRARHIMGEDEDIKRRSRRIENRLEKYVDLYELNFD